MTHELVTIEGSRTTKSTALEPGARMRVVRTPYIDALIAGGFAVVIDTEPMNTERVVTREETDNTEALLGVVANENGHEVAESRTFGGDVHNVDTFPMDESPVPPRNAKKERWAAFLDERGISYPEGAKHGELISLWDEYEREHGE